VSSSSSEAEKQVGPLLRESFQVLSREHPEAYARMCACLAELSVVIGVDEERFVAEFSAKRAWVRAATDGERARPHVTTRRHTLLDVLDNRQELTQAVLTDAVELIRPMEELLRLHEGLLFYVRGAVRCSGFIPLLRRLRASISQPDNTGAIHGR
jgi:hypothetical protein